MKFYEISNKIRTRCIPSICSSEVISHVVSILTYIFVSKIPAVSGTERQVPDSSATDRIARFHVSDRSRK